MLYLILKGAGAVSLDKLLVTAAGSEAMKKPRRKVGGAMICNLLSGINRSSGFDLLYLFVCSLGTFHDLCTGCLADGNLARLHGFWNFANQINVQQTVFQIGRTDFHMVSELEATLKGT